MHGKGTLYFPNGQKLYEGEFLEDKFHKHGKLYNGDAQRMEHEFDYKDFSLLNQRWERYEGDFDMDKREGFGLLYLTNGEKFAGNFAGDKISGYGAYYQKSGTVVNGYWENDRFVKNL